MLIHVPVSDHALSADKEIIITQKPGIGCYVEHMSRQLTATQYVCCISNWYNKQTSGDTFAKQGYIILSYYVENYLQKPTSLRGTRSKAGQLRYCLCNHHIL